jgi:hypothetical protein
MAGRIPGMSELCLLLCDVVEAYRHFGDMYFLYLQGRRVSCLSLEVCSFDRMTSSTNLNMEAVCYYKTPVYFYHISLRHCIRTP